MKCMYMMTEEYKDIRGYEGLYQVSNYGNIKSLGKHTRNDDGSYNTVIEYNLYKRRNKAGYLTVPLIKDGVRREFLVHKLVASAFLERIDGLYKIRHKDSNRANNNVLNLEWCAEEPQDERPQDNTAVEILKRLNAGGSKRIVLKRGNDILMFDGIDQVVKLIGVDKANLEYLIRKNRKFYGWEIFSCKYANEEDLANGLG